MDTAVYALLIAMELVEWESSKNHFILTNI